MSAKTRWVSYNVDSVGTVSDGDNGCKGSRGYSKASASVGDTFNVGATTNRLYISIDGDSAPYITLYSGAELDPRFVARDITEKLHSLGKNDTKYDNAYCEWTNDGTTGNCFKIYSGSLGSSSSVVVTVSGTSTAGALLGWNTKQEVGGIASTNGFGGDVTVSGVYKGFLDEVYHVVVSSDTFAESVTAPRGITTPVKAAANIYAGTIETCGTFNGPTNITYTLAIDIANGTTMGASSGNVPRLTWQSSYTDDSTEFTELLYPDHWYKVGNYGLMVKFSDAVFTQGDPSWTIDCYKPDYSQGVNASTQVGTAQYVYSSNRGDMSYIPVTTTSGGFTALGSRGLSIRFNPSGGADSFNAGDEFYVICSAPPPEIYDVTSLSYGNVTVSAESPVKCLMFEVIGGAVELSTVKVGLQSHGTFSHHNANNSDTKFRFGTVGPDNTSGAAPAIGTEWYPGITAADIDNDIPPTYLYNTVENLSEVLTADESESVGNVGLMSDPMLFNIKLGTNETGANSTINVRLYFDYS